MKHGSVDPDEVYHGGVPILQHSQTRCDMENFERSYNNEEREYCLTTMSYQSQTGEGNPTPGFPPRPAIFYLCNGQNLMFLSRGTKGIGPHLQGSESSHIPIEIVWR